MRCYKSGYFQGIDLERKQTNIFLKPFKVILHKVNKVILHFVTINGIGDRRRELIHITFKELI